MALGKCTICTGNQAKYKCPKCLVEYCSVKCFKDPKHAHKEAETGEKSESTGPAVTTGINDPNDQNASFDSSNILTSGSQADPQTDHKATSHMFEKIAQDPVVKSLLGYKLLQVHFAVLLRILSDSRITNEPLAENRKEIANLRLCELRVNGAHENELVEEFVQRVLYLTQEAT